MEYLKGNPNYFTNVDMARDGLTKYVNHKQLLDLIKIKLKENNISTISSNTDLIDNYLNLILDKENVVKELISDFNLIKSAYIDTLNKYGIKHAKYALQQLFLYNNSNYFTNKENGRLKLKITLRNKNVKKIILSNIDIHALDINNIDDVTNRFVKTIGVISKSQIK